MSLLNTAHLGPTSYRDGLRIQESLVAAVAGARAARHGADAASSGRPGGTPETGGPDPVIAAAPSRDWLLFPDHPPVLTVGRSPSEDNFKVPREVIEARGIEIFEVARGGDVTWHGPGQLVGYTVCDLDVFGHDMHRFLRQLEQALLDALAGWGIEGRRVPGRTGIWVGEDKIASIGVAVRRWVTYHGFALNVCSDLSGFELIHPCGLHGIRMATVSQLLGSRAPSLEQARRATAETVARNLGYAGAAWASAEAAWKAAGAVPGAEPGATEVEHRGFENPTKSPAEAGQVRPNAA